MSKSEEVVLDFEKICRLCLLEKRSMSAIFSKKKGDKKVPLPVRIMSCASLELYEGDGLPASICNKCLLSVNQSFAFREQCEQADTTLRQYAQRMNETNEEPSTTREPGERIANISLEPIEDVEIKNKEGSGDGRGVGGGVEEKEVVEQDEKYHRDKNARDKVFGLGMSSFVSEQSSSSETKGNCAREELLDNEMGLFKRTKMGDVEWVVVDEKLNVLVLDKMKRVSDYEGMEFNESGVKEEDGTSVSPGLGTWFKEKAENVIVVADVETIRANFISDVKEEDGGDFNTSRDSQRISCRNESTVKDNSVNDVHVQLLQRLIKNKEIVVQKRSPHKILIMKDESGPRSRQKENESIFKMAKSLEGSEEEVDLKLPHFPHAKEKEIAKGIDECQSARKLVPKGRNKPEIIFEECSDDKNKNDEGGKQKWKHGRDTVFCKDCKIFLLRSSYCNHIKFVHKKVRKYLCQSCGYAACTGTILRQHVQAVHDGYSFYCDLCPKTFNLLKRLRRHVEVEHLGKPVERNHVCQYCGMAFTRPAYLKRHLRSHTQETPYQCPYCHRRFKYHWAKVQHERLHTGEKPYKCSFCDERFTQNCVRKLHEYKKHGNEEFKPKTRAKKVVVTRIKGKSKTVKKYSEDSRGSLHSGSEC